MSANEVNASDDDYPGKRLGLPPEGPGSRANFGSRIVALMIDWLLANLAAFALVRDPAMWSAQSDLRWVPLAVWFVEVVVLTALTGASAGQRLWHLQVIRLDRQRMGLWRSLVRTILIMFVLPPLVTDQDGRGLHDLAVGTVVVRAPRR